MSDQIATSDYVLWAYRLLLGREPENTHAIEHWEGHDPREIVSSFLQSPEFVARHPWMAENQDLWIIHELPNGIRFWLAANASTSRAIMSGGYHPDETAFVRRFVKRGMNVVDIGAGIGWFAVNLATLVGPAGHVDAVEPKEELVHYLRRTVAENRFGNVAIHQCVLGSDETLVSDSLKDLPARVPLRQLDTVVWSAVHFIRLNVGGAEKLVLDGADLILSRDRPIVLSAVNRRRLSRVSRVSAGELVKYFDELEYEVRYILPGGRCGDPVTSAQIEDDGDIRSIACLPAERAAEMTSARR
jgi:FkbM family methyltransferase